MTINVPTRGRTVGQESESAARFIRHYEFLPEEVTDYAVDQLADRLTDCMITATERACSWDPHKKALQANHEAVFTIFEEALQDKAFDLLWEVRHGQRDDFTRGSLEGCLEGLTAYAKKTGEP